MATPAVRLLLEVRSATDSAQRELRTIEFNLIACCCRQRRAPRAAVALPTPAPTLGAAPKWVDL